MGKKKRNKPEPSHAEIWDDSALVDSWNEAYEEYKYYHSIHARGEKVSDVLEAYERGEDEANMIHEGANERAMGEDGGIEEGEVEDGEVDEDAAVAAPGVIEQTKVPATATMNEREMSRQADGEVSMQAEAQLDSGGAVGVPEQLLANSTHDPALKNLMMSWYWAGYYSGLYQGQQQAKATAFGADSSLETDGK